MTTTIVGPGIPDDFNQMPEIAKSREESSTSVEIVVMGCECECAKSRLMKDPPGSATMCFQCPCKCGGRGCWDGMVATPVLARAPGIFSGEGYAEFLRLVGGRGEAQARHTDEAPKTDEGRGS